MNDDERDRLIAKPHERERLLHDAELNDEELENMQLSVTPLTCCGSPPMVLHRWR
ncbi:MAG TPA: hypothetical protein VE197_06990 [Mycobacterium sp.]|nr:hypothetical protein [Mycobacterium sp.]